MINYEADILGLIKKCNTSYKYFFLLGAIDSLKINQYEYSFDYLSKVMIAEAFMHGDFVSERYTKNDRLFDLMNNLVIANSDFGIKNNLNDIVNLLDIIDDKEIQTKMKNIVLYVPYRLIVTDELAIELSGMHDWLKNEYIENYSQNYKTIYKIQNRSIIWRKEYYEYILKNKEYLKNEIVKMIKLKFIRK